MILSEIANKPQILVVYPGRFQPFHKGHKSVYDHLSSKFDNVFIATSDKVDPPKSPFSFEEKKKMMELTGMDTANVVLTKMPYVPNEITQNFDKENTILILAVSEKDMAEDPRFAFKPKKDGSPSYFQAYNQAGMDTMDKHGYIMTVPTMDFKVMGKPMKSATEIRAMFSKMDAPTQKELIKDLFGNYSKDVHSLMAGKITEGGWTDTVTQQTKLTPSVVKEALTTAEEFIKGFNTYLADHGHPTVTMGSPTGSSAYYNVDNPDVEYGDIDLQVIIPDNPEMTANQQAAFYNDQMDTYIATFNPANVHDQGKPAHGHPIFDIGENKVQIDFMWAPESVSDWARYRTTPERGVKGVIYGNMYSAFGDLINLSIQTAGVQMKTVDGKPVPFSKRKDTELHTLSTDISNYGIDIVKAFYQGAHGSVDGMQIDPVLKQYPGLNKNNIKISDLAHTIKGIAKSFELNGLYGGYGLENYSSADELISAFLERVEQKAEEASNAPKFKKAHTPGEMDMVRSVQQKIAKGLQLVKQAFAESKKIKIGENKKMSAQKLGIFAKGKNKINLWEHDGKVVLVHQGSNRLQESKKSVKETVDALHKKGYVCESVDMITMKNAAGAIMRVMYDTIKGTTTVRDKQGGSHTYEAPGEKVVAALQKKGYQKQEDDFGGLSLVPTDAERQQGLI